MAKKSVGDGDVVVIKKYANRRLYNTASSSYVTLEDLSRMVQEDVDFRVYDAKSGEDLTRSVLTQIIVEEEQKGDNLLPIGFLRQIIGMYGDNMRWMLPQYLDASMQWFSKYQEDIREQMPASFSGVFPMEQMEEWQRQNMAVFEQAMRMFNPFAGMPGDHSETKAAADAKNGDAKDDDAGISELRDQIAEMQRRLNEIADR